MKRFRVITGGKSQDGPPVDPGPALYRAHSSGTFVKANTVYEDVLFHWYCLDRPQPVTAYTEAIARYEEMEENARRSFERYVDRLFTEEEVDALDDYLQDRYGLEVHSDRISLPVKDRAFLFEEGSSVIYEFLELSERPGYSLPFKVWGYFTLHDRMTQPMLEDGVELIEEVFKRLSLQLPVNKTHLENILRSVFEETRLVVKRLEKEEEEDS